MKRIIRKSGHQSRRPRAPTLADVANLVGCAPSVVSTVVNGAKGNVVVSEAMRERVLTAATELGYRVNFASRSLATKRTYSIGLYFPDVAWSGPGYSYDDAILSGVQSGCRANGYDLVLVTTQGEQRLSTCLEYLMAGRIDGIILAHVGRDGRWTEQLSELSLPVVAVDFSRPPAWLDCMIFDNEAAVELAVDYLYRLGHRRIGFIGSEMSQPPLDAELRENAFTTTMSEAGLAPPFDWIVSNETSNPVATVVDRTLQRKISDPTAWIAWNDLVAITLLAELSRAGVKVPDEVSVMGIDNFGLCRLIFPSLTSINHPLAAMGHRAVEVLVERCQAEGSTAVCQEVFAPTVAPRESTAAPPGRVTKSLSAPAPGKSNNQSTRTGRMSRLSRKEGD